MRDTRREEGIQRETKGYKREEGIRRRRGRDTGREEGIQGERKGHNMERMEHRGKGLQGIQMKINTVKKRRQRLTVLVIHQHNPSLTSLLSHLWRTVGKAENERSFGYGDVRRRTNRASYFLVIFDKIFSAETEAGLTKCLGGHGNWA